MVSSAASGTTSGTLSVVSDLASSASAPNNTSRPRGQPPIALQRRGKHLRSRGPGQPEARQIDQDSSHLDQRLRHRAVRQPD